jgi:protein gp37
MADLFHESVPFDFIDKVMHTISASPQHRYQILTKRAERMAEYFDEKSIPQNVWLGVTVEAPSSRPRMDFLRRLSATIRFLSCEPLLEDLGELDLSDIDWVIVGGESGAKARPMKPEWVRSILNQAAVQNVAFFFKQWGTWGSDGVKRNKKANGKALDGQIIQMMPQLNMRLAPAHD